MGSGVEFGSLGRTSQSPGTWASEMPRIIGPTLPILSILRYWTIGLGTWEVKVKLYTFLLKKRAGIRGASAGRRPEISYTGFEAHVFPNLALVTGVAVSHMFVLADIYVKRSALNQAGFQAKPSLWTVPVQRFQDGAKDSGM